MRTICVLMMFLGFVPAAFAQASSPKGEKNCEATLKVGDMVVAKDGKETLLYDKPEVASTDSGTTWWRGEIPAKIVDTSEKRWVKIELPTSKTPGYILRKSLCRFTPGAGNATPPAPAENQYVKPITPPPTTGYIQPTAKPEQAKVAVEKSMPSAAAATPKAPPSKSENGIPSVPVARSARVDSLKKNESLKSPPRKVMPPPKKVASVAKAPLVSKAVEPKLEAGPPLRIEAGGLYAAVWQEGKQTYKLVGKSGKDAKKGTAYEMRRTSDGVVFFVETSLKEVK